MSGELNLGLVFFFGLWAATLILAASVAFAEFRRKR